MKFDDLKDMYSEVQLVDGEHAYKSVSHLLQMRKKVIGKIS